VGKHAAPDGSSAHPLVAAALARRQADAAAGHRQDGGAGERDGAVGWPGPPPGDSRVGWPVKDSGENPARADSARRVVPQRGWRRFFRGRAAA
jgi:hypothetical protein